MTPNLTPDPLRALPDERLQWYQREYPPIINNAPEPSNTIRWAVVAELASRRSE